MNKIVVTFGREQLMLVAAAFAVGLGVGWWQPWAASADRTVSVTGEATIKAMPDEFVFYPSYQARAATSLAATEAVREVGDAVVEGLKTLGVEDSSIRTDISSYPYYFKPDGTQTDEQTANYSLTVTVRDKDLTQRVQDYLFTTNNQGSSTPQSLFSEAKQTELKSQARKQAVENARRQGEQITSEIGRRIGRVVTIEEITGFDGIRPFLAEGRAVADSAAPPDRQTQLLTGEQELRFSVRVVFSIR